MNVQTQLLLRPATPSDAGDLARLINLAGEGIPHWLWTRAATEGETPLQVGTARAMRPSGGFSYRNAQVADSGGAVQGMVLSYPITSAPTDDPNDLPAPIAPFVELEKHSVGTWYVNALAVYAKAQGRGIGTRLLAQAEDLARAEGVSRMSIQVYGQNRGALRLYQRLGYAVAANAPVRVHPAPPYYTGDVLLLTKKLAG